METVLFSVGPATMRKLVEVLVVNVHCEFGPISFLSTSSFPYWYLLILFVKN